MSTIPGKATASLFHTMSGAARIRIEFEGASKSVPLDYSSNDPFWTAVRDVLGNVRVNDQDRNIRADRVVFYLEPSTITPIRPDYTVKTYADGMGRWCARIVFPYGLGNSGEAERILSNARRAAQRAIRAEIIERAPRNFTLRKLGYDVISNGSTGNGQLTHLTIREA